MARLDVLEGLHAGSSFALTDEVFLGRGPENRIRLLDNQVSRQHARISRCGASFVLEDLNSANGTLLRGERILPHTPCDLHEGDEIWLCSTRLVFRTEKPATEQTGDGRASRSTDEETGLEPLSQAHNFETLVITMRADDKAPPTVTATFDASKNLTEIDHHEKATEQGMQHALKRLQVMCQISAALGAITDHEALMQRILDCIFDVFPNADRSLIMLREGDCDDMVPIVARKRQETPGHGEEMAVSRTIVNEVFRHNHAILSFDAMNDNRFDQQASVHNLSIRSMMCAPLFVHDEILGIIQVDTDTHVHAFTSEDLQILTGISVQAALALKNFQLAIARNFIAQLKHQAHLLEAARIKAEEANVAKSLFLANVSHELRTPLHGILSFAGFGIKKADTATPEKLRGYFQQIEQSGRSLLALVNDLLDLAKLESGKMIYEFQSVDLSDLLTTVIEEFSVLHTDQSLTIQYTPPGFPTEIVLDPLKMSQVIRNLLSNAIKFSPEGGTIEMSLCQREHTVVVCVSDQGPGIPEEERETIFDKFVQSSRTKTGAGGTGLGLPICRQIVTAHQGRIWAENRPQGGAILSLELPLSGQ